MDCNKVVGVGWCVALECKVRWLQQFMVGGTCLCMYT